MRQKKPIKIPWPDFWCVVDLEATCDEQDKPDCVVPREEMETIEIGAVMVDGQTYEVRSEFQTFVRPVRNPQLTPFCRKLTGISPDQVDQAPEFPQAWEAFLVWANRLPGWHFGSWGRYDVTQFRRDGEFWGIDTMQALVDPTNLKRVFARQRNIKECGIPAALSIAGLGEFQGDHHRGIDDARNAARLLAAILDLEEERVLFQIAHEAGESVRAKRQALEDRLGKDRLAKLEAQAKRQAEGEMIRQRVETPEKMREKIKEQTREARAYFENRQTEGEGPK